MDAFATLEARGFIANCSGKEQLAEHLSQPRTIYAGFDPTADSLHAGHLVPIMAMSWLQRAGHRPIAVLGTGTAMVGDPTGKTEMRKMLSRAQIAENGERYRAQMERVLTLDGSAGLMLDNGDWLLELKYIEFLREIGMHFSVNRMLAAEAYKQRLERGLSFIEFNYQILQAYDFLELHRKHGCTVQLGGDDQWGNILAGTDLVRRVTGDDVFGLTHPLVLTATGEKMGKTVAGAVWLSADRLAPFDYYQYWLNVHDADVARFLKLYTFLSVEECDRLGSLEGAAIREGKRVLAREATTLIHGAEAAAQAEAAAAAMVAGAGSDDLPTHALGPTDDERLVAILVAAGITSSLGEGRRLVANGGVKLAGDRVDDPELRIDRDGLGADGLVVRVGKKRAVRLVKGEP